MGLGGGARGGGGGGGKVCFVLRWASCFPENPKANLSGSASNSCCCSRPKLLQPASHHWLLWVLKRSSRPPDSFIGFGFLGNKRNVTAVAPFAKLWQKRRHLSSLKNNDIVTVGFFLGSWSVFRLWSDRSRCLILTFDHQILLFYLFIYFQFKSNIYWILSKFQFASVKVGNFTLRETQNILTPMKCQCCSWWKRNVRRHCCNIAECNKTN